MAAALEALRDHSGRSAVGVLGVRCCCVQQGGRVHQRRGGGKTHTQMFLFSKVVIPLVWKYSVSSESPALKMFLN